MAFLLLVARPTGRSWSVEVDRDVIVVGRSPFAHVRVEEESVSRNHLRLRRDREGWSFEDLASRNGVRHRGEPAGSGRLREGETLELGDVSLTLWSERPAALPDGRKPPEPVADPGWLRETPYWALSAALHLLLLLALLLIPLGRAPSLRERRPLELSMSPGATSLPYDALARRDLAARHPLLAPKEAPFEPKLHTGEEERDRGEDALDPLDDFSSSALASRLLAGLGSGATRAYGDRRGRGSLTREGGSEATESAVRAALEWLRRHQSPDGSWRAKDWVKQCRARCKNLDHQHGDGRGSPEFDVGVTGLALLALAGHGNTHRDGARPEYVASAMRAVEWLRARQVHSSDPAEDGRFGPAQDHWVYNHAIATMALGELLAMSGDVGLLGRPVRDAARLILHARNQGLAWRYGVRDGENDVSVTGWQVLALKTVRHLGLGIDATELDEAFAGALRFIDTATDPTGRTGYTRSGEFHSRQPTLTAVAMLSRLFAGVSRQNRAIRRGVDLCLASPPLWDGVAARRIDQYYWYYASYALFQHGGAPWAKWNRALQPALLESQRRGGDEDGSWDPIGPWAKRAGRVYSTALGAMTLEVYYRYRRLAELPEN